MEKLKLLASSFLVTLTFYTPQVTQAMEEITPETGKSASASMTAYHPLEDFLQHSPLYHQVETERYRESVHTLRHEILKLQGDIAATGTSSESSIVKQEIDRLTEMLDLQKQAFQKYGSDLSTAKKQISCEIEELKESNKINQKNIMEQPHLKGLYEAQLRDNTRRLKTCEQYLTSLDKSQSSLQAMLETTRQYLKTLDQQANSADHLKDALSQKIKYLQALYEAHVKGTGNADIFPHHLPKVVLECLGISSARLNNVHTERLFQLFARTLELPYVSLQPNKEQAYLNQLASIKQNLANRLQEDMLGLQMSAVIAKAGNLKIEVSDLNAKFEKLLINVKLGEATSNKDRDLETLQQVLLTYGYREKSSPLLESILKQSSYGLLGLYIASLEFSPVTSWSDANKVSSPGCMNALKNVQEFSDKVMETIYLSLGRYLNRQVLLKIEEKLQKSPEGLAIPYDPDDFYV